MQWLLQAVRRFGVLRAAWMLASELVLVDALAPHECLVDFVAVAPENKGRGVGAALMRWAEAIAVSAAPGAQQSALVLWVRRSHHLGTSCRALRRNALSTIVNPHECCGDALGSGHRFTQILGSSLLLWVRISFPDLV